MYMDNRKLTRLLGQTPETRLAIFDLVSRYITPTGIDLERLRQHHPHEVEAASEEAADYAPQTKNLNDRLKLLATSPPRQP